MTITNPDSITSASATSRALLVLVDEANTKLEAACEREGRAAKGQFTTPSEAAVTISGLAGNLPDQHIRLLDPGAGVGSLTVAFIAELVDRGWVGSISVDLVENDAVAVGILQGVLKETTELLGEHGITLQAQIHAGSFCDSKTLLEPGYDVAILNPPYLKLGKASPERTAVLARLGVDTSNLYTAFLVLAATLLRPSGQLLAITPRSFANGAYFGAFRSFFASTQTISDVVLFERRDKIFKSSSVLQETVIFRTEKRKPKNGDLVSIYTQTDHQTAPHEHQIVPHNHVVSNTDKKLFYNFPSTSNMVEAAKWIDSLPATLGSLALSVATGQVVDFRSKSALRADPEPGCVPLIYPTNVKTDGVRWPKETKKPQALADSPSQRKLTMPNGYYVVVKRFTSKEEPRRIVAGVLDPIPGYDRIAFENHVNVIHRENGPLTKSEAVQIASHLNGSRVDTYFRMFSGSTQVNATDIRRIRFPEIDVSSEDRDIIDLRVTEPSLFGATVGR